MPETGIENSNNPETAALERVQLISSADSLSRWGLPRAVIEDCLEKEEDFSDAPMVLGPVRLAKAIKSRELQIIEDTIPAFEEYISQGEVCEMLYQEFLEDDLDSEVPFPLAGNLELLLPDKATRSYFAFRCAQFGMDTSPVHPMYEAIVRKREKVMSALLQPEVIASFDDAAIEVCLEAGDETGLPGLLPALDQLMRTRNPAAYPRWSRMYYVTRVLQDVACGAPAARIDQYRLRLPVEMQSMPRTQQLRAVRRLFLVNESFAMHVMENLGISPQEIPDHNSLGEKPLSQHAKATLEDVVDMRNPLAKLVADDIDYLLQDGIAPPSLADFGVTEVGEAGLRQLKYNILTLREEIADGIFDASALLGASRQIVAECVFLSVRDEPYGFLRLAAEKYQLLYRR